MPTPKPDSNQNLSRIPTRTHNNAIASAITAHNASLIPRPRTNPRTNLPAPVVRTASNTVTPTPASIVSYPSLPHPRGPDQDVPPAPPASTPQPSRFVRDLTAEPGAMDVGIALEIARTTLSLHLSDFEELKGKRDNALGVGDWERARACERQMKLLENDREGMKVDIRYLEDLVAAREGGGEGAGQTSGGGEGIGVGIAR